MGKNKMKKSQLIQLIKEEIRNVLNESENDSKIYGQLLHELLISYNEYIGGYDDEIYEICDNAANKISENKWYTANDVANLDSKNKNIVCGGVLIYAFSMDSEFNINHNYFAYYADKIKSSKDGIIYGFPEYKIKYYQNLLSYAGRGFFYNLASKINYNPIEWYRITGDENFDAIAGILNKQGIDYKNIEDYKSRDINQLIAKGKIGSMPTPIQMGEDLEVELASLRSKK